MIQLTNRLFPAGLPTHLAPSSDSSDDIYLLNYTPTHSENYQMTILPGDVIKVGDDGRPALVLQMLIMD